MKEYSAWYDSPLGKILLTATEEGLLSLEFDREETETLSKEELPVFQLSRKWLDSYFAGSDPGFLPPLCPRGTEFDLRVWKILQQIPYGKTVSYGEIASRIRNTERPGILSRAVGNAVGRNPLPLMIPCHRVIRSDQSLGGFGLGPERKRALLRLEGNREL